jgi:threonine synthase
VLPRLRSRYSAFACDDAATLATIKRVFETTGRILDPHTAVAASVTEKVGRRPLVVLSTAHPAKFPDAVQKAIGRRPEVPEALAKLANLPEKLEILPNTLPLLRQFISSRLAK